MKMLEDLFGFGDPTTALLGASNILAWIVFVVLAVLLLVAATTVVRRYRRDAMPLIATAAALGLAGALLSPPIGVLVSILCSNAGVETLITGQAVLGIGGTLFHALWFCLLIRGIVKLARPPSDASSP